MFTTGCKTPSFIMAREATLARLGVGWSARVSDIPAGASRDVRLANVANLRLWCQRHKVFEGISRGASLIDDLRIIEVISIET